MWQGWNPWFRLTPFSAPVLVVGLHFVLALLPPWPCVLLCTSKRPVPLWKLLTPHTRPVTVSCILLPWTQDYEEMVPDVLTFLLDIPSGTIARGLVWMWFSPFGRPVNSPPPCQRHGSHLYVALHRTNYVGQCQSATRAPCHPRNIGVFICPERETHRPCLSSTCDRCGI